MMPNASKRRRYKLAFIDAELEGRRIILQTHRRRAYDQKVSLSVESKSTGGYLTMICQWPYGTDDAMHGSYRAIGLEQAMALIEKHFP